MKFFVYIRHPDTGEIRVHVEDCKDPGPPHNCRGANGEWYGKHGWDDGPEYQFTEGNYSCGCSRQLFFARVGGEDVSDELSCNADWKVTQVLDEEGNEVWEGDV